VVPGGFLLFFIVALFPGLRPLFGKEPVNVGGLILLLIVSFVLGQLLQTLAFYTIQPVMIRSGLAYRTSVVLFKDQNVISEKSRERLEVLLPKDFGFAKEHLNYTSSETITDKIKNDWRSLVRRLHTKVNLEKASDRLDFHAQNYALSMNLAMSFVLIFIVLITISRCTPAQRKRLKAAAFPRWFEVVLLVLVPVAFVIALDRMSNFDRLFAEELFGSYLHRTPTVGL
jgi:hypothetical protein